MKYYILKNREMPWGDYGDILFSGLLTVMDDDYNDIDIHEIERTGSYIPEIYCVNSTNLVLSENVKIVLLKNNITGIDKFHYTIFKKIVNIDWKSWNQKHEDPAFFPETGEPIDYIEDGEDDTNLHNELSVFYSIKIKEATIDLIKSEDSIYKLENPIDIDLFIPSNMNRIIVSEKFKKVIESEGIDTLKFIEIQTF
ncbi:hypothetical protein [Cellulophaga sp. L1A9]|uniref:hypothetical protein n=1 Tax=Cellulophaga sp. L1A9 TaxID=2686362 RepID=UPI00131DF98E|nr:hypothetical protein [Cellulophaga sp. L1A9]